LAVFCAKRKEVNKMKKILFGTFFSMFVFAIVAIPAIAVQPTDKGFDEYGYNRTARNFVGTCLSWGMGKYGWTVAQATAYCGDYSNDKLVMKWNAEWDRGNAEGWTDPEGYDAWEDNEWNGRTPGGSGEMWHYKISWDKGCADDGTPSTVAAKGGAYCLWGSFAMLQSQGSGADKVHVWDVLMKPAGYGAY
jgi:hypothetical protein